MNVSKVLAVYLPQFHQTPDNDRWWGEGFTDWKSVQSAEKYFEGHMQPRIPLDGDYYNLLKKETMQKQAALAREYGIDGFCFYHYYFKNGKKELELPAENLLKWKDIDISYCFNWASEPWIRSWSRIAGNVWAEKYDSAGGYDERGVLVGQDYGTEREWCEHFYYLLPFFRDKRYIRIDNRPVFLFYSPEDIRCLSAMTECWRNLAQKEGLGDLYLIGARMSSYNACLDAAMIYEPRYAINRLNEKGKAHNRKGVRCFDYQDIWDECVQVSDCAGMKTYYSGVVDYDDTPRRGKSGECFINVQSDIFKEGIIKLLKKSAVEGKEFVLINAWNEWGEGMHLEPDLIHEFQMLKAIKAAKEYSADIELPQITYKARKSRSIGNLEAEKNLKKFKELFQIIDQWLFLEQENRVNITDYLASKGYGSFAIYGMASLGKHLLIQARKEGIEPKFGIDRYVGQFGEDFKVYRPEEKFPYVDCIIVTAYDYEEIGQYLKEKVRCEIIYLGDMISSM